MTGTRGMKINGWITLEDWCAKYEERRDTIHARVHAGRWKRGVHFSAADGGSCFVHEKRAREWLVEKGKLKLE